MSRTFINAVEAGHVIQAQQLHKQGVSVNTRDKLGHPAIYLALMIEKIQPRLAMVSWLLRAGADTSYIDPKTGRNLLATAAFLNCTAEIHQLLEHGTQDVMARDRRDRTALHYATVHNNLSAVFKLCEYSRRYCIPALNLADDRGWTPFSIATVLGFQNIVSVLVKVGRVPAGQIILPSMNLWAFKIDYHEFRWFLQAPVLCKNRSRPQITSTSMVNFDRYSQCPSKTVLTEVARPRTRASLRSRSMLMCDSSRGKVPETCPSPKLTTPLSNSFVNDCASSAASVTSVDHVRHLMGAKAILASSSYRAKAEKLPPKPPKSPAHRPSLSFAMVAKITTVALSLRKKNASDSKLPHLEKKPLVRSMSNQRQLSSVSKHGGKFKV